jgi:hypothetical protein
MTTYSILLEASSISEDVRSVMVYFGTTLLGGGLLIKLLKLRPENESKAVQTAMDALDVAHKSLVYLQGELKESNRRIAELERERIADQMEIARLRNKLSTLEMRVTTEGDM